MGIEDRKRGRPADLCAAMLVVAMLTVAGFVMFTADQGTTEAVDNSGTIDGGSWRYSNGTLTITGDGGATMPDYTFSSGTEATADGHTTAPWYNILSENANVTVEIAGYSNIGTYAFYGCNTIVTLRISDVVSIDSASFYYCTGLTTVTGAGSVETVESTAFARCTGLISIDLKDVTYLGATCFGYCSALQTIGNFSGVTYFNNNVFISCTNLVITDFSPEHVGTYSFSGCSNLSGILDLTNLDSTSIPTGAFANTGITIVKLRDDVSAINSNAFSGCGSLEGIQHDDGTLHTLSSLTFIGSGAFYQCNSLKGNLNLTGVTEIPNNVLLGTLITSVSLGNVTRIGEYAFYNCSELVGIYNSSGGSHTLSSVTQIGGRAFALCTELKGDFNLTNLTSTIIPEYVFYSCSNITSVKLSNSVTEIQQQAFRSCTNLESIGGISLSNVTAIGDGAFYRCSSILSTNSSTWSLNLSKATTIGYEAFSGCTQLVSVTSLGNATTIGGYAFGSCTMLSEIGEMSKVTSVGQYAFGSSIITQAIMPVVTSIGISAFSNCGQLTTVEMPLATTLGTSSFSSCNNLQSVKAYSLTSIPNSAFSGCSQLKSFNSDDPVDSSICVLPQGLQTLGSNAFYNVRFTEIHIPSSFVGVTGSDVSIYVANTAGAISVYFNCDLSSISIGTSALIRTTTSSTSTIYYYGYYYERYDALFDGNVTWVNTTYTNVVFQSSNLAAGVSYPSAYSNVRAVYGGKIVLPAAGRTSGGVFSLVDSGLEFGASGVSTERTDSMNVLLVGNTWDSVAIYPTSSTTGSTLYIVEAGNSDRITIQSTISIKLVSETTSITLDLTEVTNVSYGYSLTPGNVRASAGMTVGNFVGTISGGTFAYEDEKTVIRISFYEETFTVSGAAGTYTITFTYTDLSGESQYVSKDAASGSLISSLAPTIASGQIPAGYDETTYSWISSAGVEMTQTTTMPTYNVTYTAQYVPLAYTLTITYSGGSPDPITLYGPYSIQTDSDHNIIVSDQNEYSNTVVFEPSDYLTEGYSFDTYLVAGATFEYVTNSTGDITIQMYHTSTVYTLTFVVTGMDESIAPKVADVTGLSITNLRSGVHVNYPSVSSEYTFISASSQVGGSTYTFTCYDDYILVDIDGLDTSSEVQTITLTYEYLTYTARFEYDDDTEAVVSYAYSISPSGSPSITLEDPVYQGYTKVGYTAKYWYVVGILDDGTGEYKYKWNIVSQGYTNASLSALLSDEDALEYLGDHSNRIVLRVYWEANTYNVRFASGSGSTVTVEMTTNESLNVSALASTLGLSRTGYALAGWYLGEDTGDTTADNYLSASASSYTLKPSVVSAYASGDTISTVQSWTAKTYTVKFDANGGSPFVASGYTHYVSLQGVDSDDSTVKRSVTIPSHGSATRSFYDYNNWIILGTTITATDGTSINFTTAMAEVGDANNDTITFSMNWTSSNYTIVFNLNGGSGSSISAMYPVNVNQTISLPTPTATRSGYTAIGWYWTEDSTVAYTSDVFDEVMASMAESNNGTLTLYIVWDKLSYRISYVLDGGVAGEQAPTTAYYGVGMTISHPTRTGYTFVGWTASGDLTPGAQQGIGTEYITWDGASYSTSTLFRDLCYNSGGEVVMTAHWEQVTYYVEYNLNGGDGSTIDMGTGRVGESFTFASTDATREGYSFAGWSLDGETVISNSSTFTQSMAFAADDNNVVTLYAVWSPQSYTIQYRFSDTEDYLTITAYYGTATALGTPTMTGYSFSGWSASGSLASGARYSSDGTVWYTWPEDGAAVGAYVMNLAASSSDTVQLTATWTLIEYRIVYSVNGANAEAPTDSGVYTLGDPVTLADYSYLEGTNGNKLIIGWSTDPTTTVAMSVSEFSEGLAESADSSNRVTLYAVWAEGSYTMKVDLDGATTSYVPSGWSLGDDGLYYRSVDYGTATRDALADWDDAVITKEGYTFSAWRYTLNTVVTDMTVTAEFSEVQTWLIYVFAGAVAAVVALVVVYVRRE